MRGGDCLSRDVRVGAETPAARGDLDSAMVRNALQRALGNQ